METIAQIFRQVAFLPFSSIPNQAEHVYHRDPFFLSELDHRFGVQLRILKLSIELNWWIPRCEIRLSDSLINWWGCD